MKPEAQTSTSPATERDSAHLGLEPLVHGGPMRLADLVEGYWAITPTMHDEIRAIYSAHLRGDKIDVGAVEAHLGRQLANERQPYTVHPGGVAVISMSGVISPKANLMMEISGGTSAQLLRNDILAAQADPVVRSAILYADTPGGNVLGVAEAAQAWHDFSTSKPAVTYTDGQLASAGYLIGVAAPRIIISGPLVNVGSIGVRTEVIDTTAADAMQGIHRRVLTAGRYKAVGDGPMSPDQEAYKQGQLDYIYTVFVDWVATHLGVSAETVLTTMADGKVFIGQQAVDVGLAHGISTFEGLLAQMADNPLAVAPLRLAAPARRVLTQPISPAPRPAAKAASAATPQPSTTSTTGDPNMPDPITRESLEQDHPQLYAALRSEFMAAGAASEVARINAVRATALPGHEALIERLAFDGRTTGAEAAQAVLVAHREVLASAGQRHHADAPPAAPTSAADLDQRTTGDGKALPAPERKAGMLDRAYAAMNKRPTTA